MARQASREASTATEALNASRLDRELSWRVFLTLRSDAPGMPLRPEVDTTHRQVFQLRNVGPGPARQCCFMLKLDDDKENTWFRSEPIDLPPQSDFQDVRVSAITAVPVGDHEGDQIGVIVCWDALNFHYRFPVRRVGQEIRVEQPQIEKSQGAPAVAP